MAGFLLPASPDRLAHAPVRFRAAVALHPEVPAAHATPLLTSVMAGLLFAVLRRKRRGLRALVHKTDQSMVRGEFPFPEVDLPWPAEYLRVVPPGSSSERAACGDWLSLFRSAAPYIAAFRGGTVVVHVPAFLLESKQRAAFKGLMEDVAFSSLLGLNMVVVTSIEDRVRQRLLQQGKLNLPHSGTSPPEAGAPNLIVDDAALSVVKQEAGFARVEVESALSAGFQKQARSSNGKMTSTGVFPVRGAVSVVSGMNYYAATPVGVRSGVDYGYAGLVRSVNTDALQRRLDEGDIVSVSPLGASPSGEVFLVSSEELAAVLATKLRAVKLVYITQGQRIVDMRTQKVVAGMQLRNAQTLYERLINEESGDYDGKTRSAEWFRELVHLLRLLMSSVSAGVARGHILGPTPGSLLQEFYTTDGSGTIVANDVYQGLGSASTADADGILQLLEAAMSRMGDSQRGAATTLLRDDIESNCAAGQYFVWKRDKAVLGCGQLVALSEENHPLVAELRHFALAEGCFLTHSEPLLAYAVRAAIAGGAATLLVEATSQVDWFLQQGFRTTSPSEVASLLRRRRSVGLPVMMRAGGVVLILPLGRQVSETAESSLEAFVEKQRQWGGVPLTDQGFRTRT